MVKAQSSHLPARLDPSGGAVRAEGKLGWLLVDHPSLQSGEETAKESQQNFWINDILAGLWRGIEMLPCARMLCEMPDTYRSLIFYCIWKEIGSQLSLRRPGIIHRQMTTTITNNWLCSVLTSCVFPFIYMACLGRFCSLVSLSQFRKRLWVYQKASLYFVACVLGMVGSEKQLEALDNLLPFVFICVFLITIRAFCIYHGSQVHFFCPLLQPVHLF